MTGFFFLQVLKPPQNYQPIRTPARKLTATPTPMGMSGFRFQMEDNQVSSGVLEYTVDSRYTGVYWWSILEYTGGVYWSILEYTGVYWSILEYTVAEVHTLHVIAVLINFSSGEDSGRPSAVWQQPAIHEGGGHSVLCEAVGGCG